MGKSRAGGVGELPVLDLGDAATLRVVANTSAGSVLPLEWRNFPTSLPVGLDAEGEALLIERGWAAGDLVAPGR